MSNQNSINQSGRPQQPMYGYYPQNNYQNYQNPAPQPPINQFNQTTYPTFQQPPPMIQNNFPPQQYQHMMFQQPVPPQPVRPPVAPQQKIIEPKIQLKQVYDKIPLPSLEDLVGGECPQTKILSLLVKYEQNIDQIAKRKRGELQEQFIQPMSRVKQTLRVIVYSETTDESQPWTLHIKGKVLECEKNRVFSSFFKSVEVKLDRTQYPVTGNIVWVRQPNQDASGFEIKRQGPLDTKVEIVLYPVHQPQKYKLNQNLQNILRMKEGTRSQILSAFWEYVKLNGLQDKDNREHIIANEPLKQIFQKERIPIGQLNMMIKLLLENPEPIRIEYIIRHNDNASNSIKGFDILIDTEIAFQPELMPFLASKVVTDDNSDKKTNRVEHPFMILNQRVKNMEKQIQKLTEQLKSHKLKCDMYKAYSEDPSLFLENILLQQNSYLEIMNQDNSWKSENPKNLKFLLKNQEIVEKQIRRYLEHKEEHQHQHPQQQ